MSDFTPFLSILASAGSGKTFQLSYRMLTLLAKGAPPENIGAFTFSRKAAGEIFDSVIASLREAADSEGGAASASGRIRMTRSREAFLHDLIQLIRAMPYLQIGTLDAHIARLLGASAIELGLPPELALQEDTSADQIRLQREILNQLFQSRSLTEEHADLFLHLFEESTHGKSAKAFLQPMTEFLQQHRDAYRNHSASSAWEGPRIASPPRRLPPEQAMEAASEVRQILEKTELHAKARSSLITLAERCASYTPGGTWSKQMPSTKTTEWVLQGESPVLEYFKKETDLSGPVWDGLQVLADHVVAVEWEKAQRQTRALWAFLHLYETGYLQKALPGGQLTFADACSLMAESDKLTPAELAYRLDGEIDHWLLDEFQDTSRPQWRVLEPFLSEILQDPEERRSLFLVGDTKQAIYGWRGGDAELFDQVLADWSGIASTAMSTSYRSAQPVLDAVNAVFSELQADGVIPSETAERWNRTFHAHQAADPDKPGWAGICQVEKEGVPEEEIIIDHLRTLPQSASVALLVRGNAEGDAWAATLREAGFRVSREGASPLRGPAAVETVLAALRATAHPADPFSRTFSVLASVRPPGLEELQIAETGGMAALVRHFREQLSFEEDAAYAQSRLNLLEEEAVAFDQRHAPGIDAFLEHIDTLSLREQGGGEGIRIMTIHQSKGLGFDAVVVPIKEKSGFSARLEGLISSAPDAEEEWVTLLPPKAACARIPELQQIVEQETARSTYETLCVLYVALTRAKQSLFITLPSATSSPNVFGNWIPRRVGNTEPDNAGLLMQWGDPDWSACWKEDQAPQPDLLPFPLEEGSPGVPRLEPSREQDSTTPVAREFQSGGEEARALGSEVHRLLEQMDYVEGDVSTFLQEQKVSESDPVSSHIRQAWEMEVLRKPTGVKEVWREQKFESLLPEGWITGIFDRVVLFDDHAWIQDYKTNRTVTPVTVETYRPQMNLYRTVLADMLGWKEERIKCHLLFTATGQVERV